MQCLLNLLWYLRATVRGWMQYAGSHVVARSTGQGLVEYALVLLLIAVVCVGILTATGQTISQVWYSKLLPAFDR